MLATSACNQDRPTLVLFAYIALQVQIMLRICFNRGNLTCVFLGSADLGAPDVGHPQPMGSRFAKYTRKSHPVCRKAFGHRA